MSGAERHRRICRALSRLLPEAFRGRHGAEIVETSVSLLARYGVVGRLVIWPLLILDFLRFAIRERWRASRGGGERMWKDFVLGLRVIRRSRTTPALVLTLALGIGAASAMFSVVDRVVLRPLPYAEPDRLVTVWTNAKSSLAPADYLDIVSMNESFRAVTAYSMDVFDVLHEGSDPVRLYGARTTASFFDVMGVPAQVGRTFGEASTINNDDGASAPVVVLHHATWQTHFGGDAAVVGRSVRLNDESFLVLGVMPPSFDALNARMWVRVDARVPDAPVDVEGDIAANRRISYLRAIARLDEAHSVTSAQADLDRIAPHLREALPTRGDGYGLLVEPMHETIFGGARLPALMLFAASGVLLLITCANVAGILMGTGVSRQRELAIRAALGAGRSRLSRQLLIESFLLAVAGLGFGLLFGRLALELVRTSFAASAPRLADVALDARAVGFGFAVSAIASIVFGWAPAMRGSRFELASTLGSGGTRSTAGAGVRRLRVLVVAVEVALATVLVTGAGLFGASLTNLGRVDPGFEPTGLTTIDLPLPRSRYPDAAAQSRFYREVLEDLHQDPATRTASLGFVAPFDGPSATAGYLVEGTSVDPGQGKPTAGLVFASHGYVGTLGIPLLRGRDFTAGDTAETEPVALVSASLAEDAWPDGDPLGARLQVGRRTHWFRVIGIVGDVRTESPGVPEKPTVYLALGQAPLPFMRLVTRAEPEAVAPVVRRVVSAHDSELPIGQVRTVEQALDGVTSSPRLRALLVTSFSAIALFLAGMGLYAVVSTSVAEREREMGIRMALGASPGSVGKLLLREGAALGLVGAFVGLVASLLTARFAESLLFGVAPNDLGVLAATVGVLLGVTLAASYAPTLRARRLDPVAVLRSD